MPLAQAGKLAARSASQVGYPWQYKIGKRRICNAENSVYYSYIKWKSYFWYSGSELLCAWTLNVCEAFVMTCRQADATKPTVWGVAEFGRLAANKRMHGVENAALFNVPHIWSLSRNTSPTFISATLIYRKFHLHILLSKIYIAFSES